MEPQVKFGETLAHLLDERGFRRNRQKVCTAVGISPAALSQYIANRTRPSFAVLLRLAEFFNVRLDYLVFGTDTGPTHQDIDYGPLARYIDTSLSQIENRANQHSALVSRIASGLIEKIEDVARETMARTDASGLAGQIHEDETIILERYSVESCLITTNLDYDFIQIPGQEPVAGRFLPVVAANVARRRTYKFLLPAGFRDDWDDVVKNFRTLLTEQTRDENWQSQCAFRITNQSAFVGIGLYRLDVGELEKNNPSLYGFLRKYITDDQRIGYTIPPSTELKSDALLDTAHLESAYREFDRMWKSAKPV